MRAASIISFLLTLVLLGIDAASGASTGMMAFASLGAVLGRIVQLVPALDLSWLIAGAEPTVMGPALQMLLAAPAVAVSALVGMLLLLATRPWRRRTTAAARVPAAAKSAQPAPAMAAKAAPTASTPIALSRVAAAAQASAAQTAPAPAQVKPATAQPTPAQPGPGQQPPVQPGSALAPRPATAVAARTPAAQSRPAAPSPQDREFLPAALEILATPPSPVAMSLLLLICGSFLVALGWSYFGWLDIHAVAQGKIQPSGRSKVIQPLEPGKVVAIRVENGSRINAGDVLLELDPTESAADREAQASDLEAASAEASRRRAAIAAIKAQTQQQLQTQPQQKKTGEFAAGIAELVRGQANELPPIKFDASISDLVRQREQNVLAADLAQLRSTIASLRAQLSEKQATKEKLRLSIAARHRLIELSKERVSMREQLDAKGSGSRALIIEAMQQLETHLTTDAGDRGQLLETDAAIASLERKVEENRTQFIADQSQKLAEAERKRDRLVQELLKAQSKNERTQLRSPIAGTVQQLSVTTVGQVVTSGQSLATIVPVDGQIEVEAMIANKDIGFVKLGQPAVVKVEAFPFTRYGVIDAQVIKISRDAVDERDAPNMTDAATAARPQNGAQNQPSSRSQNLVFPATLRLAQGTMMIDGEQIGLTPGMSVTVEIKTGQRRALDFVLSPLRELSSRAARER